MFNVVQLSTIKLTLSRPFFFFFFVFWGCRAGEGGDRPFLSCFEPHYKSKAKCKVFFKKISFLSYANKTNFHMKSFAL